jgi:hypothetical protein
MDQGRENACRETMDTMKALTNMVKEIGDGWGTHM